MVQAVFQADTCQHIGRYLCSFFGCHAADPQRRISEHAVPRGAARRDGDEAAKPSRHVVRGIGDEHVGLDVLEPVVHAGDGARHHHAIGAKFKDVKVPFVVMEAFVLDDMMEEQLREYHD